MFEDVLDYTEDIQVFSRTSGSTLRPCLKVSDMTQKRERCRSERFAAYQKDVRLHRLEQLTVRRLLTTTASPCIVGVLFKDVKLSMDGRKHVHDYVIRCLTDLWGWLSAEEANAGSVIAWMFTLHNSAEVMKFCGFVVAEMLANLQARLGEQAVSHDIFLSPVRMLIAHIRYALGTEGTDTKLDTQQLMYCTTLLRAMWDSARQDERMQICMCLDEVDIAQVVMNVMSVANNYAKHPVITTAIVNLLQVFTGFASSMQHCSDQTVRQVLEMFPAPCVVLTIHGHDVLLLVARILSFFVRRFYAMFQQTDPSLMSEDNREFMWILAVLLQLESTFTQHFMLLISEAARCLRNDDPTELDVPHTFTLTHGVLLSRLLQTATFLLRFTRTPPAIATGIKSLSDFRFVSALNTYFAGLHDKELKFWQLGFSDFTRNENEASMSFCKTMLKISQNRVSNNADSLVDGIRTLQVIDCLRMRLEFVSKPDLITAESKSTCVMIRDSLIPMYILEDIKLLSGLQVYDDSESQAVLEQMENDANHASYQLKIEIECAESTNMQGARAQVYE